VCSTPISCPPIVMVSPGVSARSGDASGHTTSHSMRSASCSRIGASSASRSGTAALMWSLWPWVSTMARTAAVDRLDDGPVVVGGVEDDHLTVVADDPDVVGDLPLAAVEREDPVGGDQFDAHQNITTLRSTSPRSILWNASSTPSSPIVSDTNRRGRAALQVQVDQHREVARRQAVAVPRRLERPAAPKNVDERQLQLHLRVRHADEHHGAGEVAGVERLLVHLGVPTASMHTSAPKPPVSPG
jgi:hypothetical protein